MWTLLSLLLVTQGPAPHVLAEQAAAQVDEAHLSRIVQMLQETRTRVTGTRGVLEARDRLAERLVADGLVVERRSFFIEHYFAEKRVVSENLSVRVGPVNAERLVLVAHLDSRGAQNKKHAEEIGWRWAKSPSPGADDNASGSAVLAELARILKRLPDPKQRIDLVWAGAEEMAQIGDDDFMVNMGGEVLAEDYASNDVEVVGALAVDMFLRARPWGSSFRVYSDGRMGSQDLAGALFDAMLLVAPRAELQIRVDPGFTWSDHGSFWARGWPGVLFIEDDMHHERYHRANDYFDPEDPFYSVEQLVDAARMVVAAVVMLSQ